MRVNANNNTMDMERRDTNYVLRAYIKSYLFHNNNKVPSKIVIPMIEKIEQPVGSSKFIPIEYVPEFGDIAVSIEDDTSNIPEVVQEEDKVQPEQMEGIKAQADKVEPTKKTKLAVPDRAPKKATNPAPGSPDNMGPRDTKLQSQIAKDLLPDAPLSGDDKEE